MTFKLTKFVLLLVLVNCIANVLGDESPGFFLKVTKNVPRLGRRSQSINDYDSFFLKTSKSVPRIGRAENGEEVNRKYNSVHPFDSKSLHHQLASEDVTENDFKFVSWANFDFALENDEGLFQKLLSITNDEQSMAMLLEKLSQDSFLTMNDNPNGNKLFYRINRSTNGHNP